MELEHRAHTATGHDFAGGGQQLGPVESPWAARCQSLLPGDSVPVVLIITQSQVNT